MSVHPVYGTGIQTLDFSNMSHLPQPLDQGSRPLLTICCLKRISEEDPTNPKSKLHQSCIKFLNIFPKCLAKDMSFV